jgi:hypothetical protein
MTKPKQHYYRTVNEAGKSPRGLRNYSNTIVIPRDICRQFDIATGDIIRFTVNKTQVILEKELQE